MITPQSYRVRFLLLALTLGALAVGGLVSAATDVTIDRLLGDPAAKENYPPYTGALTTLGLFLWCAAAAVCLFAAPLVRKWRDLRRAQFLIGAGALSALLLADDAFLLHENAWRIGPSENMVLLGYVAVTGLLFWMFWDVAWSGDRFLLILAGGLFALAIAADKLHDVGALGLVGVRSEEMATLAEDGLKLLGIAAWLSYLVWTIYGWHQPDVRPAAPGISGPAEQ